MKIFTTTLILLISTALFSQNWTGNVDADWNNSANWSNWPLNGASIVIDPVNYTGNAATPTIAINSVFTPNDITIQNGGQLNVQANLTTTEDVEILDANSSLTIQSGTVNVGPGNSGRLIVDLSAAVTISGGTLNVDQRFIAGDNTTISITGGNINVGQRFIVELGAQCIVTGGIISITETLAIADGNANQSSLFQLINGTVTVGIETEFENEVGNYTPTFFMDGGSFTTGDIFWFGAAPGSGTPMMRLLSGNATINGDIINMAGSTVNMFLLITGIANVQFNGSLIETIQITDTITQIGASTFSINTPTTWNNNGAFRGVFSTITFNNNTTLQGSGVYDFHGLTINPTFALNHVAPTNISVKGNFTNNGTFTHNANTVNFTGTSAQQISGASTTTFYNLVINHSSTGITLNQNIQVNNSLTLTNGKLISSSTNLITLIDNATSTLGNNTSFVEGPFKKVGNDAFIYPIGKDTLWRRLVISAPTNINSEFVAEYFDAPYSSLTPVNAPISNVSNTEYWELNKFNTTDNVQVTLHWEDAALSGITTCSILSLAEWTGTEWNDVPSTINGACTANNAGNAQSNNAVSNGSIYTFAFLGVGTTQILSECLGDSVTVGTNTYGTSGTYVDTLTNINNTDSLVTTILTIIQPVDSTINILGCEGDTVYIAGKMYYQTGTYLDTVPSIATSCDSIMTINLTITVIDTSVTVSNDTLFSNHLGATYQWYNCELFTPISGETSNFYSPSFTGNFAVVVSQNGCVDTSSCRNVTITNISSLNHKTSIAVSAYPNPTNNIIHFKTNLTEGTIEIYNIFGALLTTKIINSSITSVDTENLPSGNFIYKITDKSNNTIVGKFIKQ
ncbi:MAG: T9SS type A sorting domain-containing protein [Vicingaceae bacterium]|nr:T9SS type A sorting domain-containing protein [Vicingaceae bacterium]